MWHHMSLLDIMRMRIKITYVISCNTLEIFFFSDMLLNCYFIVFVLFR